MELAPRRIPLRVPYRIAGRRFDTAEILFVILRDETGATGFGSGSPVPPLTGDDFDSATRALEWSIRPAIVGRDIPDLAAAVALAEAAAPRARSALAAVDIALHDLCAKRLGLPLVDMLGGVRRRLFTSVTVGIETPQEMANAARRHVAHGFRILKIKIGEDAAIDMHRLERIRDAVGDDVALRVDANEGYAAADAIAVARRLEGLAVELFEQPIAAAAMQDLGTVGGATSVPVVVDESVKVAADLAPLVETRAARGANIKLMKCGGIREALRIDAALSQAGWRALVGCMDESRASIAAAAHFAAAAGSAEWIDLDGHLDLVSDPFDGGFKIENGEIVLGDGPGLGLSFSGFR